MVVPWRAMEAASRRMQSGVGAAVQVAVGVLLFWALFDGGASGTDSTARLGTAAVAVAASIILAWALGALPLPRLDQAGLAAAVAAAALVAWSGLTIWWSIAGDRSWDALAKGIVQCPAFGVVGPRSLGPRGASAADAGASSSPAWLGAVLVAALIGKAIPGSATMSTALRG